jgi:hypothetical protein
MIAHVARHRRTVDADDASHLDLGAAFEDEGSVESLSIRMTTDGTPRRIDRCEGVIRVSHEQPLS